MSRTSSSERDRALAMKDPTNPFEALFTPPKPRGNPRAALAAAAVRHEGEYSTPIEHHNPMELFATTAVVEKDGRLTVYDKTQGVQNVQRYLCSVLRPEARASCASCRPSWAAPSAWRLRPQFQAVLAVLAARALGRSVRVVLTRQQMYVLGHRPAMIQRIAHGRESRRDAGCDHP